MITDVTDYSYKEQRNAVRMRRGFTIVELLIVIVVIGILAAITIATFSQVQARARDASRREDVATIQKALELYYTTNGTYPSSSGSTKINAAWVTTADTSWANLESQLVPNYISKLPKDPKASSATNPAIYSGFNYDYIELENGWCNTNASKPGYLLSVRFETSPQEYKINGDCPSSSTQPTNYDSSEFYNVK